MMLVLAAAAWLIAGAVLRATGLVAEPFIGMFVEVGWMASGLVLLGVIAWRSRTQGRRLRGAALAVGTMAIGLAVSVSGPWFYDLGANFRFAIRRGQYLEIATAEVRFAEPRTGEQSARGFSYLVDAGPPVRVAFPEPGGIVDNWCAVIYDASGSLQVVNASVLRIFGGDLVGCRPLDSVFFRCCFT